jgi:hypothetical protein
MSLGQRGTDRRGSTGERSVPPCLNHGEALSNVLATEPGWEVAYPDDGVAIIYRRKSAG